MSSPRQIPCARAVYNFDSQGDHELSFRVGMSLHLLRRVDENWLEGELEGKIGIFPSSHVRIELGSPSLARENDLAGSGKPYALALFTFNGEEDGDLSFSKGELVELLGSVASGWLRGKVGEQEGIFPASFVEILRGLDSEGSRVNGELLKEHPVPKPRAKARQSSLLTNGSDEQTPTPSRSAPAPPTSQDLASLQSNYSSMTLPKPKPRGKLMRHASVSTTQHHIHSLEANLAIEQKMMESAQNLLTVCQNEVKREKLTEAIRTHKSKADHLREQIREARAQQEAFTQPSRPPAPPSPPTPTRPLLPEQQRLKVIEELILTEKDFHHQMDVCCKVVVPALAKVESINDGLLFGNLEDIVSLSGQFLSALEETCNNKQQLVGKVFVAFAPQMGNVYALYCRNRDSAVSMLEKCAEDPVVADKIKAAIEPIRHEILAWNLQSLLIKPVQRVLKYPLLLDKLVEFTEDGHADYKSLQGAREAIGQMAQDINELKRRKDIVERYTGATREERRVSMSMHSLQKKVRRLQQTITQKTGLRSKTVDPKFDDLEQKVTQLETLIRNLLKDIQAWLDSLQNSADSKETLYDGMVLYCPPNTLHSLSNFKSIVSSIQQNVKSHVLFVSEHVVSPLQSLLELFQDPLHLISKRRDKLLDYDHVQYSLEHAEEVEKIKQLREDCLMAKRNYEALNIQLIEELPRFHQLTLKVLRHLLNVLAQAQYTFHSDTFGILEPFTGTVQPSTAIQQNHATQLAPLTQQLVQLSVVPASLNMKFVGVNVSPNNRRASTSSEDYPILLPSSATATSFLQVQEEEEASLDPPEGTELVALYTFAAQDKAELSVGAGELVTLVCPHDRIGCREWWLVHRGTDKGYVPATYLTEAVSR